MKSINDFRREHGEFTIPDDMELAAIVQRVEAPIEDAFRAIDARGLKSTIIPAARMDLAAQALSEAEGFPRRVESFRDLSRAELIYIEAWLTNVDVKIELKGKGWLPDDGHPTGPDPRRILKLLREDPEIAPRTRSKLIERYIPQ